MIQINWFLQKPISGSTLFAKTGHTWFSRIRVKIKLRQNVKKCTYWHVRPRKIQISLHISLLSAWRKFACLAIQNAFSEDSDQTARMRRLIWIFAGRICPKVRFLTLRSTVFVTGDGLISCWVQLQPKNSRNSMFTPCCLKSLITISFSTG